MRQWRGLACLEQSVGIGKRREHGLRHWIVQCRDELLPWYGIQFRRTFDRVCKTMLDAFDGKSAAAQNVGRFRRPERYRAEARHCPDFGRFRIARRGAQHVAEFFVIQTAGVRLGAHEIHVPRGNELAAKLQTLKFAVYPLQAKRREGWKPIENDHGERVSARGTKRVRILAGRNMRIPPEETMLGAVAAMPAKASTACVFRIISRRQVSLPRPCDPTPPPTARATRPWRCRPSCRLRPARSGLR